MTIELITFDLDDTLWHTAPVIMRAEETLRQRCPRGRTTSGTPIDMADAITSSGAADSGHFFCGSIRIDPPPRFRLNRGRGSGRSIGRTFVP